MTNEVRPTPEQLGESILRGVRDFVSRVAKPLDAGIKALGERIDALPSAAAMDALKAECALLAGEVKALSARFDAQPVPENGIDGKDGACGADCDMDAVFDRLEKLVNNEVDLAIKTLPAPIDGKDGQAGQNGADCDMAVVESLLSTLVEKRVSDSVAALPIPKDGADGKDGAAGKDAFAIAKDLGFEGTIADWLISIRGKDGTHGLDGRDALPGEPGRDGLSCDEIVAYEEGKHFGIRFMKGGKVLSETKWLKPTLADLDEGTWQPKSYERGAHVTWAGCTWFAKADTAEEPGRGEAWRLMAKKGRDGRDRTERKQNGDGDVYRIAPK
jgi:hypothetical protein